MDQHFSDDTIKLIIATASFAALLVIGHYAKSEFRTKTKDSNLFPFRSI